MIWKYHTNYLNQKLNFPLPYILLVLVWVVESALLECLKCKTHYLAYVPYNKIEAILCPQKMWLKVNTFDVYFDLCVDIQ